MDDGGDMEVPDCATDGSCPEDGGGGGDDEDWTTPEKEPATLLEETQNALQQFSIVVGVCLMVGILFFLMIAVEQTYDWILGKMKKVVGTKKTEDPEDPASLVGSFKRYKN